MIVISTLLLLLVGCLYHNPDADFRSSDAKWADNEVPFKGRNLEIMVFGFELYKLKCGAPKAVLLRTTARNWINIFAWPSFFTDKKWRVPYAEPVPEIGNYYPPVSQKNCYSDGSSTEEMNAAQANARRYLNRL